MIAPASAQCTLVRVLRLSWCGGLQLRYGPGQYIFDHTKMDDSYCLAHMLNGQPRS
jgi:hypothetical protein